MDSTKYTQVQTIPEFPIERRYEEIIIPVKNVPKGDPEYYNPFKVRNQMIINSIQLLLMITYVWYTKETPYTSSVAEFFILIHSSTTISIMLFPQLAENRYTRNLLLGAFVVSDTYTVHILSNSKAISGEFLSLIFFLTCAMKSIFYVDKVFYAEFERAMHPHKPRFETSELVLSLVTLGLILFMRGYAESERAPDLVWGCVVIELLVLFHWYYTATEQKSQVLEQILAYGFIISEAFILDATWPSFLLFDVIIFFGYIPRILAYLGYDNCFQNFKEWMKEWIDFFVALTNQYIVFCIGGALMIVSALWGVYTENGRDYLNIHTNLIGIIITIEAALNFTLGLRPEIGRSQMMRLPLLAVFVLCESYILAYFCAVFRMATSFLVLYLPLTLARNIIFIRDKFVGPATSDRICGGLTLFNSGLRLLEAVLIFIILLNLHFGTGIENNYNFMLTSLIMNLYILLIVMLTPDVASKPPMNYILLVGYMIMEAYSLAVFAGIIWKRLDGTLMRVLAVPTLVYCALEKTAAYTKTIEPAPLSSLSFTYSDGEMVQHHHSPYNETHDPEPET